MNESLDAGRQAGGGESLEFDKQRGWSRWQTYSPGQTLKERVQMAMELESTGKAKDRNLREFVEAGVLQREVGARQRHDD